MRLRLARGMTPGCICPVKSRMFINALEEQFWAIDLPAFDCLDGALMVQGALGNVVVAGGQVLGERGVSDSGAAARKAFDASTPLIIKLVKVSGVKME